MFAKIAILACTLAVASAGYLSGESAAYEQAYAAPVATYAAAVPSHTTYSASPLSASYAAAVKYAPSVSIGSHSVYSSAPLTSTYAAAAPVAHATYAAAPVAQASYGAYSNDLGYFGRGYSSGGLGYSAGLSYAAGHGYAARSAHPSSLLGIAYSPAIAVSHATYSSPIGANYAW